MSRLPSRRPGTLPGLQRRVTLATVGLLAAGYILVWRSAGNLADRLAETWYATFSLAVLTALLHHHYTVRQKVRTLQQRIGPACPSCYGVGYLHVPRTTTLLLLAPDYDDLFLCPVCQPSHRETPRHPVSTRTRALAHVPSLCRDAHHAGVPPRVTDRLIEALHSDMGVAANLLAVSRYLEDPCPALHQRTLLLHSVLARPKRQVRTGV